jgi:hypothetical protein
MSVGPSAAAAFHQPLKLPGGRISPNLETPGLERKLRFNRRKGIHD